MHWFFAIFLVLMGLARHGDWDVNKRENKTGEKKGKRNGVSIRGEHIRRVKIFYFWTIFPCHGCGVALALVRALAAVLASWPLFALS